MSYPAPEECFVIGDLQNAVGILDIPSENQSQDGDNKTQLFNNAADLAKYLGDEKRRAYSCRFMYVPKPSASLSPKEERRPCS